MLKLPPVATTAGGLEGGIGKTGFEVLKTRIDGVALLTEEEIFEAVRFMLDRHQYLVEPSSAVTVAAILTGKAGPHRLARRRRHLGTQRRPRDDPEDPRA